MAKLNVAIIGVGGIARTHMPGWDASPHAEVIASADINAKALQEWGKTHQIKRLYADALDAIRDPDVHIVDLCVPNMLHAPLAIAALDAGKHVLCEKPLAPTPGAVRDMIAARDRSGKLLMTAQHHRFSGVSQALKREIDAGALGEVYHARSWMLRRNAFINLPTFVNSSLSGGGACIDIGVHVLDLTLWLMGHPAPVSVTGVARNTLLKRPDQFCVWRNNEPVPESADVEDFASAFVRFDTGATLILEVSWLLHHDTAVEDMQIWLYGTEGGAHWPRAELLSTRYDTRQLVNTTLKRTQDTLEPHALECVEFARAIVDGRPAPVPPEQSLQVMAILDGIYRSQKSGKEVAL